MNQKKGTATSRRLFLCAARVAPRQLTVSPALNRTDNIVRNRFQLLLRKTCQIRSDLLLGLNRQVKKLKGYRFGDANHA